jgi:hypothetical protein
MTQQASDALARLRKATEAPAGAPPVAAARTAAPPREKAFRYVAELEPSTHGNLQALATAADEHLRGPGAGPGKDQVAMADIVRAVADHSPAGSRLRVEVLAAVEKLKRGG